MANSVFSHRLKQLRKNNNLTMEELGKLVNVKKSTIANWENLGSVPNSNILKELSGIFSVSVDYLIGNDSNNNSKVEILQRGINKLSSEELNTATNVLSAMFSDIFNEEDDEDEI